MQELRKRYRFLPQSLKVMFWAFMIVPLLFAFYSLLSFPDLKQTPVWFLGVYAAVYMIVPFVLAHLLLRKSEWFLYAVMGECVALLAVAFVPGVDMPLIFFCIHYGLVLMMVVMALMLINRDILFPFIFTDKRGFRRAPRVAVNHRVKVYVPDLDKTYDMLVEDCSVSGIALYGGEDSLDEMFLHLRRGMGVKMTAMVAGHQHDVPLAFMWQNRAVAVAKAGFTAIDPEALQRFFTAIGLKMTTQNSGVRLRQVWANRRGRRVMNYAFAAVLLGVMVLPPFAIPASRSVIIGKMKGLAGLLDRPARSGQPKAAKTRKAAKSLPPKPAKSKTGH